MSESVVNTRGGPAAQKSPSQITPPSLPEQPLAVIGAGGAGASLDLSDLWAYRELLFFLAWRDLKIRYKQTALGVLWVVMQPLLLTLIFTVFLGQLARVPSDGVPYPLFIYVGLLPWTFFSSAVGNSGNSLVGNAHLITKVYFPRLVIPAAAVMARLVDFLIAFVILLGLLAFYRVPPTRNILMVPALVVITTLLALGLGLLISALNVKYRDIGIALPVLLQLLMFVSPIIYPTSIVPERWRSLYSLNPVMGIVEGFRAAFFGLPFDWPALGVSAAASVVIFVGAMIMFRRVEKNFADLI